jgi:RimJ/RimL family protein N-acetyltransferase
MVVLKGARVVLRPWRDGDRAGFRRMGADPKVMEFMPNLLDAAQADALADQLAADLAERGWGAWALEVPRIAEFGGFVGLRPTAVVGGGVEALWRLDTTLWGQGYASEAAALALDFGFRELGLPEIIAFTATVNHRSQAVMRRLEMRAAGEFDHPILAEGHWLRRHVLYRKTAA